MQASHRFKLRIPFKVILWEKNRFWCLSAPRADSVLTEGTIIFPCLLLPLGCVQNNIEASPQAPSAWSYSPPVPQTQDRRLFKFKLNKILKFKKGFNTKICLLLLLQQLAPHMDTLQSWKRSLWCSSCFNSRKLQTLCISSKSGLFGL